MDSKTAAINQLIHAVMENDVALVNQLLNDGVDPNHPLDPAGVMPLHYAAQNNALDVIPLLIEAGADVFAQTEPDGSTPIDIAAMHQHDQIVQLFAFYMHTGEGEAH